MPRLAHIKKIFRLTIISLVALIITFFILHFVFPLPDKIEYSTIVTDEKGEVIHAFITSDDKWRMKTTLNEISPLLKKDYYQ